MKALITLAFYFMCISLTKVVGQPNYPVNPEDASLVTTDLENFISAWNAFKTSEDSLRIIQEDYIEQASPGLVEYIRRFDLKAESILESIRLYPGDYNEVSTFLQKIEKDSLGFTALMKEYKSVLPKTVFAPTYLLVADHRGINQASAQGQLVTVERAHVTDLDKLRNTIVHELTHFQQAMTMGIQAYAGMYAKENNMLDIILREGCADFVTFGLVRDNRDDNPKLRYFEEHESELWERFKRDLENQNKAFWIGVPPRERDPSVPVQPGYGVGYKIVEAYFNRSTDKEAALHELLLMSNTQDVLERSGYDN